MNKNYSKNIENFKNSLNIEGYSKNTIDIYCLYLDLFEKYIQKDINNIESKDIINYLSYIKNIKKISSTTINLIISIFNHYYKIYLKKNINIDIKLPKKSKKLPTTLTNDEIKLLIKNTKNKRNKLIIEFIFSTGTRISECVNMKIDDLDFIESVGKVVSGKGNKDRIIILSKKWIEKYRKYLKKRENIIKSKYLFCTSKGANLSVDTIQKFLKESAKQSGINKKVSPHTLRHSFATSLLENDVNIRYIQQLLGHTNLNTTQIYTKVNTNKLKKIKNPLDNL
ncbi:MAG: tyrosine-type recombinase/integrase [Candidatus ainarchaeum sp.]|nr:tyrosine-type recombinase/integrase [Candidatus ainarchaeum sp.]MDD3975861.1 tyrosine-type recombinase/integrase [Candidatus ainarchaeum sp.]